MLNKTSPFKIKYHQFQCDYCSDRSLEIDQVLPTHIGYNVSFILPKDKAKILLFINKTN